MLGAKQYAGVLRQCHEMCGFGAATTGNVGAVAHGVERSGRVVRARWQRRAVAARVQRRQSVRAARCVGGRQRQVRVCGVCNVVAAGGEGRQRVPKRGARRVVVGRRVAGAVFAQAGRRRQQAGRHGKGARSAV